MDKNVVYIKYKGQIKGLTFFFINYALLFIYLFIAQLDFYTNWKKKNIIKNLNIT